MNYVFIYFLLVSFKLNLYYNKTIVLSHASLDELKPGNLVYWIWHCKFRFLNNSDKLSRVGIDRFFSVKFVGFAGLMVSQVAAAQLL